MAQDGSTIGLNPVPLVAPAVRTATVCDPAIDIVRDYIRAIFNTYAATAWRSVAPPTEPIVKRAFSHDPQEYDFNEDDLPALYLFRTGSAKNAESVASDIRVHADSVRMFWVLPPAPQEQQARRVPIIQALGKLVDLKIERVRDPAYVLASDPDTTKTEQGTVVIRAAGLNWLRFLQWQTIALALKVGMTPQGGAQERKVYQALECKLEFEEQATQRYDDLTNASGVDALFNLSGSTDADGDPLPPVPFAGFTG
jgi:hypothetical protein